MNMFIPLASSAFIEFTVCPPLIHPGRLRLAKLGGLATAVMRKASVVVVVVAVGRSVGRSAKERAADFWELAMVTMGVASPTEMNACSPGPLFHQEGSTKKKLKNRFVRSARASKSRQNECSLSLSCSGAHSQQARCRDRLCGGVLANTTTDVEGKESAKTGPTIAEKRDRAESRRARQK